MSIFDKLSEWLESLRGVGSSRFCLVRFIRWSLSEFAFTDMQANCKDNLQAANYYRE